MADPKIGTWTGPAFYTVGGAASETAILVMTERGVSSFLSNSLNLGADVGVAVGPVGVRMAGER